MDIKNKSKDNAIPREDFEMYCDRQELNLVYDEKKKPWKPKAPYTLTKEQIENMCSWVGELKFPDGYVSNMVGRVNEKGHVYGIKSHDCHVFMQRLLSLAFSALPKTIGETLTDLSQFFRDICSTVIREKDMERIEVNIVEILCNLENIFPPGFFDSMEHLPIHLPYEAKVSGPVQYGWMYPFERFLRGLIKKVTNKNKVAVNAYLNEEVSRFCSLYFEPIVETRLNGIPRNDDGGPVDLQRSLSISSYPGLPLGPPLEHRRLSDDEIFSAHRYVLTNYQELYPYIELMTRVTT